MGSVPHGAGTPPTPRSDDPVGAPGLADGIDLRRFRDVFAVVLLPTLNEEAGLARTLSDLPAERFHDAGRRLQPLIIDGGSIDGTLAVAREWDVPVLSQTSRGKGGAMLEAIAWVHRRGIPHVVVLDADATYPPDRILPAVELLAHGADLVVGVRRRAWGPPADLTDLVHRVGNLSLSYAASVLSHRPILDLCSGFWGVSTPRFLELQLDDTSFAIEAELVLKSIRRGYSVHQIPVSYHERLGEAKLRAFRDGTRILRTIVREARPGPTVTGTVRTRSSWGRDLVSIALALSGPGPLGEWPVSGSSEAGRIAALLERTLAPTPSERTSAQRVSVRPPVGTGRRSPPDAPRTPLSISLPIEGTETGGPRSAIVTIRTAGGSRSVELRLDARDPSAEPNPHFWSRSGGWATRRLDHRTHASSLTVLTSRLDFRPGHQQETLLAANGFHVLELVRDIDDPDLLPVLEALASDP
ncbi:MAG: glycosyltransferase family 2 protein [Thermoplasmata archaeon]|nr:glycosyltransferase family 2 protein [Thermoplasmata archaeon]